MQCGVTTAIQRLIWQVEAVAEDFHRALYVDGDAAGVLAAVTADCAWVEVPTGAGSAGPGGVRAHVDAVLRTMPGDVSRRRVTRTSEQHRVVEEAVVSFLHDREVPWLLPGVAPTGARVEVLAISVLAFRHTNSMGTLTSRLKEVRTLWDQAGLRARLGLA